jgi:hypothetical protein
VDFAEVNDLPCAFMALVADASFRARRIRIAGFSREMKGDFFNLPRAGETL